MANYQKKLRVTVLGVEQPPTTLEGSKSQSRSAAKRQKTSTVGDYRTVKIEPTGFGIAADMPGTPWSIIQATGFWAKNCNQDYD